MASITSSGIHNEMMKLMQQNGGYRRTWVGGLRFLNVSKVDFTDVGFFVFLLFCFVFLSKMRHIIFFFFFVTYLKYALSDRPAVLSGWMGPTGAMLSGCMGSPTILQI